MNEQRLEADLNLIQALLSCPSGEEQTILAANQELIDAGLVQMMLEVANDKTGQGDLDNANRLMNIAGQLLGVYGNSSAATTEEALNFLMQVLQATAESNGNAQVVYPLLQENWDKLDDNFAQVLQGWADERLPDVEPEEAQSIAAIIGKFSNLITDFPLGNRASNLEIAITGYEIFATIFTRTDFPVQWAAAQNNLGTAYSDRIREDRAENLEAAIKCYQQALAVRTRTDFPVDWAITQNNLGIAYSNLEQIDEAMACFRSALEIYTPSAFPIDCLRSGRNLGKLAFRIGRWAEAIEGYRLAIDGVEQSRTWATSELRRREILEQAIEDYQNMVQACLNTGQLEQAIAYVERSKARNLVDLLATRDLYPKGEIPEIVLNKLDRLRREITTRQRRLENTKQNGLEGGTPSADGQRTLKATNVVASQRTPLEQLQQELRDLQQQLNNLIAQQIQPIDPSFSLTQKVEPINFQQIQTLLPDDQTAIIQWYITAEKFFTFIIRPGSAPDCPPLLA